MKLIDIDVYSLMTHKKKLVCFGAGKAFLNFLGTYDKFDLKKKVELVLDNDQEKNGTQISLGDQSIKIISVERFCKKYDVENYILLITCMDVVTVYDQLQRIEQFNKMECCIYTFVKRKTNEIDEKNRYYPKEFRIYDKPVIPKVIHYCWFGGTEIPAQNKEWMVSWKKYCPDYEIIEWNEDNYDVKKNKYMYEAYLARKWGFVPDYARLDIIYNYGGIYLDTDVELIKCLDDLLYQDAFMGVEGTKYINLGLGFGAKPNYYLLKELMDEYDKHSFYNANGTINDTASPELQLPFFKNHGYINNGEFQKIGNLAIYPEKVLSGKSIFGGGVNPTEHTFSIHHYDGSWVSEEKRVRVKSIQELYKNIDSNLQ